MNFQEVTNTGKYDFLFDFSRIKKSNSFLVLSFEKHSNISLASAIVILNLFYHSVFGKYKQEIQNSLKGRVKKEVDEYLTLLKLNFDKVKLSYISIYDKIAQDKESFFSMQIPDDPYNYEDFEPLSNIQAQHYEWDCLEAVFIAMCEVVDKIYQAKIVDIRIHEINLIDQVHEINSIKDVINFKTTILFKPSFVIKWNDIKDHRKIIFEKALEEHFISFNK